MFSLNDASALAREPEVAASIDAVERYLRTASGPSRFRQARGTADAATDVAAYRGLVEIGVAGALLPEELGGSGLAPGVATLIAERLGWGLAREPYVENIVLPVCALLGAGDTGRLRDALAGSIFCVAWQEGPFALPGEFEIGTRLTGAGDGFRLTGSKRYVMGARTSTQVLVLGSMDGEPVLAAVAGNAAGVSRRDSLLADGTCWSHLDFDTVVDASAVLARGPACIGALVRAVELANLALAGMLYGLQSRILAMTLEYLATREQFGRPIGAFQALQHRAVDLYMHVQIARFLVGEMADAAVAGASPEVFAANASRAKARTVDAALRVAKEGIQMHGGIGFSDEYDLGMYVKRILVLSAWLGGADWHRRRCATLEPGQAG